MICYRCEGEGWLVSRMGYLASDTSIEPFYEQELCYVCNGMGKIETEEYEHEEAQSK